MTNESENISFTPKNMYVVKSSLLLSLVFAIICLSYHFYFNGIFFPNLLFYPAIFLPLVQQWVAKSASQIILSKSEVCGPMPRFGKPDGRTKISLSDIDYARGTSLKHWILFGGGRVIYSKNKKDYIAVSRTMFSAIEQNEILRMIGF